MPSKLPLIDTNVIIRYLVEDPKLVKPAYKGVFSFFPKIEAGLLAVEMVDLVVFEVFFVLTRLYRVPRREAAAKLEQLIEFKGIVTRNRSVLRNCLRLLQTRSLDLVDAFLLAVSQEKGVRGIYSFDSDLAKAGLSLLKIE
ncbi:MAG: PIN domain-containing protein [Elusimicrobia bacterium]|nr:PIN domain-containing protein [Elusimicrobiota bacterium]MBP9128213.1 PIN domain-containing protein [Elusimicrobiota bacterium]MBP9698914.1 PIN domain-containing protein [Elusimicrobiota bacterium]